MYISKLLQVFFLEIYTHQILSSDQNLWNYNQPFFPKRNVVLLSFRFNLSKSGILFWKICLRIPFSKLCGCQVINLIGGFILQNIHNLSTENDDKYVFSRVLRDLNSNWISLQKTSRYLLDVKPLHKLTLKWGKHVK